MSIDVNRLKPKIETIKTLAPRPTSALQRVESAYGWKAVLPGTNHLTFAPCIEAFYSNTTLNFCCFNKLTYCELYYLINK